MPRVIRTCRITTVLARQQERVKLLLTEIPQAGLHEVEHVTRTADPLPRITLLRTRTPPELEGRRNPRRVGRPDAQNRRDRLGRKRPERTKRSPHHGQHPSRGSESRPLPSPAHQHRNELLARKSAGAQ